MDHFNTQDLSPPQPGPHPGAMIMNSHGAPPPQPQPQQLPPQMFTTAAQLLDLTDKKLILVLRDGRKLIGILRSWDQFGMSSPLSMGIPTLTALFKTVANLVLQSTVERIFATISEPNDQQVRGFYADKPHGIFLVRGENVLLLGEIDLDKDDDPPPGYQKAEYSVVEKLATEQKAAEKAKEKKKLKGLATLGFEGESMGEILL
ncbi:hypothetical protein F4861DRAFT_542409 [Xylaria intraflava]|nr:hypothetical protein F4861DRAFT_542409 [Xylaria intraflava]